MAKMKVVRPGATRRTVGVLAKAEPSGQRCATYADRPPSGRGRLSPGHIEEKVEILASTISRWKQC